MATRHGQNRKLTACALGLMTLGAALAPPCAEVARAQSPVSLLGDARYLALGDSLSAGYGAIPTTRGFTYQLLARAVIDSPARTIFTPAAVPGATSQDVLAYQVPQAPLFLKDTGVPYRKVITLTIGGNDLLTLLGPVPPAPEQVALVLEALAGNLGAILATLLAQSPDAEIYVGNLYDPRLPVPGSDQLIMGANQAIAQVVAAFPASSVTLVDLYGAFQGRTGLLLGERSGADPLEVHPTNSGYRVMTDAFADAIRQ
jgi:lysophospholipase L1-like esterase